MIYGLVGYPAAGKSLTAQMISKRNGAPIHCFSDILRDELAKQGQQATRENLQQLAVSLRKEKGNGFLAEKLIEKIGRSAAVVDGFRSPAEVSTFRNAFGDSFKLIFVDAPIETRFDRAVKRDRAGGPGSFEEFKEAEEREATGKSFGITECISMADEYVDNSGSLEQMGAAVNALLN